MHNRNRQKYYTRCIIKAQRKECYKMKYLERFIEAYLKLYDKIKKPLIAVVVIVIIVCCILMIGTIFHLTGTMKIV